jgi:hypothetical protein
MQSPAIWTSRKSILPPSILPLPKERHRRFGFPTRGPLSPFEEEEWRKRRRYASFTSPGNPNPHRGFNYLSGDPGQTDPLWLSVVFLGHFDLTSPPDSSQYANTLSSAVGVGVSASDSVFGGASLLSPGTLNTDFYRYNSQAAYVDWNGSVTYEGFFKFVSGAGLRTLANWRQTSTNDTILNSNGASQLTLLAHGTTYNFGAVANGVWHYFAFCGSLPFNGQASGYLDIGLTGTATRVINLATGWQAPGAAALVAPVSVTMLARDAIGFPPPALQANAFIDEMRLTANLTVSVARYSGATMPTPTVAFQM